MGVGIAFKLLVRDTVVSTNWHSSNLNGLSSFVEEETVYQIIRQMYLKLEVANVFRVHMVLC
jgi:hypothetical protein